MRIAKDDMEVLTKFANISYRYHAGSRNLDIRGSTTPGHDRHLYYLSHKIADWNSGTLYLLTPPSGGLTKPDMRKIEAFHQELSKLTPSDQFGG